MMRKTRTGDLPKVIEGLVVLGIGILFVYPLLFNLTAAFKPAAELYQLGGGLLPKEPTLNHFRLVLSHQYFGRWYVNTAALTVLTLMFRLSVVTTAAYGFARMNFRFKSLLFMIILSTMMVTPDTTIVPRYIQYRAMGILDSWWALLLPGAAEVFFLFLLRQFFAKIPAALTESAAIDGASHWTVFTRIIVPMSLPAVTTTAIFTFVWTWNDFINPFIFIRSPELQNISVGLQYFRGLQGANISAQLAAATLAIIPTAILFVVTQRVFVENLSSSGLKG